MSLQDVSTEISNQNHSHAKEWMSDDDKRFELLILSEAGKPIYTFTRREDAVTLMPLCSALINYAKRTQNETLQSIRTSDNLIINFYTRPPLIIIVIHDANSYVDAHILVDQVEAQIISTLTAKSLKAVFEQRPTYDLKRSLYGSEKLIDAIINISSFQFNLQWPWVESYLAPTSVAAQGGLQQGGHVALPQRPHRILVPVVVIQPNARDNMHIIIMNAVSTLSKNIVFSLLFCVGAQDEFDDDAPPINEESVENLDYDHQDSTTSNQNFDRNSFRLLTVCNHHDRHKIKVDDIHLVLAFLCGSKVQLSSAECVWMPICLPKFNQDAFLHAYISYINNSKHCLVMMSIDRNDFAYCQQARNSIEEKIGHFISDANQRPKIYYRMSPLVDPVLLELQENLIDHNLSGQELQQVQEKSQIYNSKVELYHARQLRFLWYQTSKQVLWWQRCGKYLPNSIIYYMTKKMLHSSLKHLWLKIDDSIYLGWHVPTFQLYAQFDSTITANEATEVIQRIASWIKKEEDNFSIKDYK